MSEVGGKNIVKREERGKKKCKMEGDDKRRMRCRRDTEEEEREK